MNNLSKKATGEISSDKFDLSQVADVAVKITPTDGYKKKLEIITQSNEMSDKEKLREIEKADEIHIRYLLMFFGISATSIITFLSSPAGARFIDNMKTKVA